MIDFSYFCEVIFVVVGECKFSESSQFFFIWVLSFVIVYFADPCLLFYVKESICRSSSWLRECSFSLTICRQDLRVLIPVLEDLHEKELACI